MAWDASSNNRAMLAGKASVVLNAISVTREAENDKMPISDKIWLAKAAKGPVRRMGLEHVMSVYVIWKFAENIDGAKKFLVDYVGNFHEAFMASEFYNFPCFPKQVPDLKSSSPRTPRRSRATSTPCSADSLEWATNVGYPGYSNAAIDDVYSTWVLNTMFAQAATGRSRPRTRSRRPRRSARRSGRSGRSASSSSVHSRADRWRPSRPGRCARSSPVIPRWTASTSPSTRASSWSSSGRRAAARPRCSG